MPLNMTTTPIDYGKPVVEDADFEDNVVVTLTGPNKRLKAGTILARSVADPTKFNLFVVGGSTDGNGVPAAILTYDTVEKISAGSGDVSCRPAISGKFNFNRLVVDAAGNNSTLTKAHLDLLRARGFTFSNVTQLGG